MKTIATIGGAFLAMGLLTGCIFTDVRVPGPINYITQYTLTSQDFKVLGEVEATGEIRSVLNLVMWGGDGHEAIMKKARAMGGDSVMNYTFSLESYRILTFVYNKATWRARATVVRYNDGIRATPRVKGAN